MSWFEDSYVEWAPNETENASNYFYGDGFLTDDDDLYVNYDAGQTPTAIYPPPPLKVRPPSGPPPVRPPSAPVTNPPSAPRIRRSKQDPMPSYEPEN